ncbi:uncharacterized protein FIBRA_05482 [Fibroporia radiculosa]|uniref:Uncharacterized protein n=1 Tax=Fibroporia radiculosa TaxID=599839 RepID=J4G9J1_9APHY|nr:uncharacterized protein FIBRA_05482 [Fibroporia radiculosa]CCM03353.1 predicted protein [Fibroporia radiculosa]
MTASVENGVNAGPVYISARSADVILSDVRPIKLAYEALQAVNVLLDELLYSIISAARSVATDRLKTALLKLVPTSLGKEALLEAEVEMKAYWERTVPLTPTSVATGSASGSEAAREDEFDLQWNFELLRLKCEAYSTMNDSDEDADGEARLRDRMREHGSSSAPRASEVAPAALYLTAILESICEHILSNVSSVAARDSSRTIATVQDIYIALCEDDAIYGTFKSMKVYNQIEVLSKAQRPRRSKSISQASERVSSPTPTERTSMRESASVRVRMSTDSLRSSSTVAPPERRSSSGPGRGVKRLVSHSRSSSEKEPAEIPGAGLSADLGRARASADFEEDDDLLHEFDELMRSGATMKVSLTPDRLKSMEVFNKERIQRANRRGETRDGPQFSEKASDENTPTPSERPRAPSGVTRPPLRHVDSINEDEEEPGRAAQSLSPTPLQAPPRTRQTSKSFSARSAPSSSLRLRSISISDMPHPRHEQTQTLPPTSNAGVTRGPHPSPHRQNSLGMPGMLARARKIGRNRESMDLDEIMAGSDEESSVLETDEFGARSTLKVPRSTPASPGQQKQKPHISQTARDLIAFLDEGPPGEVMNSRMATANTSVISFESSRTRSGKLSRMMSKLTIGSSTEKMNGRGGDDPPKTPKTPRSLSRKPSLSNFPPPPSFRAPSLVSKKSYPNVVVSPPRVSPSPSLPSQIAAPLYSPPPSSVATTQMTSPSPTSSTQPLLPRSVSATPSQASTDDSSVHVSSPRRGSMRKAVPVWDERGEHRPPVPPLTFASSTDPEASVQSHNGSIRVQPNGVCSRVESTLAREESTGEKALGRNGSLVIQTTPVRSSNGYALNGHGKTSGSGVDEEEPALTLMPLAPRRSPVPRKPPPSPIEAEHTTTTAPPSPLPSPASPGSASTAPRTKTRSKTSGRSGIPSHAVADLRRLLGAATTADECRLLVDMFFTRQGYPLGAGASVGAGAVDVSDFPVPPPLDSAKATSLGELGELERSLVELFLGDGAPDVYVGEDVRFGIAPLARASPAVEDATPGKDHLAYEDTDRWSPSSSAPL